MDEKVLKKATLDSYLCNKVNQINCLMEEIDSLYHQAAVKLRVSDSVLFILYMTYTEETCLLHNIYKLSGISKQTINSAIRKLEQDDLVYLRNYNGKSKIVCLTEKGKCYAEQTAGKLLEAECRTFESWSKEEINQYIQLTERYNMVFRKQIEQMENL